MARNIEIKARIDSLDALAAKAATIATEGPIEIAQDDTFFRGGRFSNSRWCWPTARPPRPASPRRMR